MLHDLQATAADSLLAFVCFKLIIDLFVFAPF